MKDNVRKNLKDLTFVVARTIRLIDAEINLPSTNERGKRIAKIINVLEIQNDIALHFVLKYSFKKMAKIKRGENQ